VGMAENKEAENAKSASKLVKISMSKYAEMNENIIEAAQELIKVTSKVGNLNHVSNAVKRSLIEYNEVQEKIIRVSERMVSASNIKVNVTATSTAVRRALKEFNEVQGKMVKASERIVNASNIKVNTTAAGSAVRKATKEYNELANKIVNGAQKISEAANSKINSGKKADSGSESKGSSSLLSSIMSGGGNYIQGTVKSIIEDKKNLSIQNAKGMFDSLQNQIIQKLTPIIARFADILLKLRPVFERIVPIFGQVAKLFDKIFPMIEKLIPTIGKILTNLFKIIDKIFPTIEQLLPAIGKLFTNLFNLINVLLKLLGPVLIKIMPIIQVIVEFVIKALNGIIVFLTGIFTLNWKKAWDGIRQIFISMIGFLVELSKKIGKFFGIGVDGGKAKKGPKVGTNANGTSYFGGGLSLVGEEGPELVNLPRGSQVFPNSRTKSLLNGMGGGNAGISVNYSPQITIQGNADAKVMKTASDNSYADFERKFNALMDRRRRLSFAGG
jgi:hypothetical protein